MTDAIRRVEAAVSGTGSSLDCPVSVLLQGIEPTGNRVMRPAVFTVDTFSAGQGQVTVYLDHPDGAREEVRAAVTAVAT